MNDVWCGTSIQWFLFTLHSIAVRLWNLQLVNVFYRNNFSNFCYISKASYKHNKTEQLKQIAFELGTTQYSWAGATNESLKTIQTMNGIYVLCVHTSVSIPFSHRSFSVFLFGLIITCVCVCRTLTHFTHSITTSFWWPFLQNVFPTV